MRSIPPLLVVIITVLSLAVIPPSTAQATPLVWDAPVTLSESGGNSFAPHIVTDGATITAIWTRFNGLDDRVQSSFSTDRGETWSAPVNISNAGQNGYTAQLVTDGTLITAIWNRSNGNSTTIQTASSADGGATWSAPVDLPTAGQTVRAAQIVTDGSIITAIFERFNGDNFLIQSSSSSDYGATWSLPTTLSVVGRDSIEPQVVIDDGVISVSWNRFDGSNTRVQVASSLDNGSSWSTPSTLSLPGQDGYATRLVRTGNTITVGWSVVEGGGGGAFSLAQVSTSVNGGTTWGAPTTLSSPTSDGFSPRLASDGSTITATWLQFDNSNDLVQSSSSRDGGATWSSAVTLSLPGLTASDSQVVTDGTTITATWARYDGENDVIQTSSSSDRGVTWNVPTTLSAAGLSAVVPQLVTDGGAVTVIWSRGNGSNNHIQTSTLLDPDVSRLAGGDRYETAVTISEQFDADVPVVYLATGTNYPDALSAASAAAFQDGPLLLTTPTTLPQAVRDELVRLNPDLVVIVGGTGVVSDVVKAQVESLIPGVETRRDSGADRYATSRDIATEAFAAAGATTAFIATGTNFPDALSASAAAGAADAPVILVNGAATSIDQATEDLLTVLGVQNVVIAGGTGVVSVGMEDSLDDLVSGDVTRYSGSDRYATSVAINTNRFTAGSTVFLATGLGFADALAGAARAGSVGAPLYVVPGTCVPAAVLQEITRLRASRVVPLGGPGVLSANVFALVSC